MAVYTVVLLSSMRTCFMSHLLVLVLLQLVWLQHWPKPRWRTPTTLMHLGCQFPYITDFRRPTSVVSRQQNYQQMKQNDLLTPPCTPVTSVLILFPIVSKLYTCRLMQNCSNRNVIILNVEYNATTQKMPRMYMWMPQAVMFPNTENHRSNCSKVFLFPAITWL